MSTTSHNGQRTPDTRPRAPRPLPSPPPPRGHVLSASLAIVLLYFASVVVIWVLSTIGPISATVNGVIEKSGGNIWFAAGGVVAAFIIIFGMGLIALYLIVKLMYTVIPGAARLIAASIVSLARFAAGL